jgi:phenylalanine-4-hydroxylase
MTPAVEAYGEQDHHTWSTLLDGYLERLPEHGCREVIAGFQELRIGRRVEDVAMLSERVQALCGWRLAPVDGLLPERDFFALLSRKVYPMAAKMRQPSELDFAELPDTFHDMLGHLPLLVHPPYTRFLERYVQVATRFIDSEPVVRALGRLYWYTTETGLVMEDGRERIFGAAIMTSRAECKNAMSSGTRKLPLELDLVFDTSYDNFKVQPWYFVIESFDGLLAIAEDLDVRAESLHEHARRS